MASGSQVQVHIADILRVDFSCSAAAALECCSQHPGLNPLRNVSTQCDSSVSCGVEGRKSHTLSARRLPDFDFWDCLHAPSLS